MRSPIVSLPLAIALAVSSSARADDSCASQVHVDAGSQVALERIDDATVVCVAPCDERLDRVALYRIRGVGIRPSNPFRLEPQATTVAVWPKSTSGFTAGTVLVTLSSAFTLGGVMAMVGVFLGSGSGQQKEWGASLASAPLFTVSLALGIPGTILLANNFQSTASPQPAPPGRSLIVPIVSASF